MSVPKPAAGMAPEPCRSGISNRSVIGRIKHEKLGYSFLTTRRLHMPANAYRLSCLSLAVIAALGSVLSAAAQRATSSRMALFVLIRRGGAVGRCSDAEGSQWRSGLVTAEDVQTMQL
jgi:hypothetical protein